MNVPGEVDYVPEGAICAECGEPVKKGDDALVMLYGYVDETMRTNEPQVTTFDYAGVYHPTCVTVGADYADG